MAVLEAILPIFLLIVLGYVLGRRQILAGEANKALGNLTFKYFMPMVLFTGMAHAPLHEGFSPTLLMAYYLPLVVLFVIVNVVAHRRLGRPTPFGLAATYSNNVLIGIPLIGSVFGSAGLVYTFAILSIHSLLLFTANSLYNAFFGNERINPKTLIATLANPLIIGLLCGVAVNLAGITLWDWAEHLATWLAHAALPCALIVLGVNLSGYRLRPTRTAVEISVLKLAVMPALTLLFCLLLGLNSVATSVLVLMAGNPAGVNVLAFARQLEDSRVLSSTVCLSTLVSAISLPLWMLISQLFV